MPITMQQVETFIYTYFWFILGLIMIILIFIIAMVVKKLKTKRNTRFQARIYLENGESMRCFQNMTHDSFRLKTGEKDPKGMPVIEKYIIVRDSLRREIIKSKIIWYANYAKGVELPFLFVWEKDKVNFDFIGSKTLDSIIQNKLIREMNIDDKKPMPWGIIIIVILVVAIIGAIAYFGFGVGK
jgi:hypothetical protein